MNVVLQFDYYITQLERSKFIKANSCFLNKEKSHAKVSYSSTDDWLLQVI